MSRFTWLPYAVVCTLIIVAACSSDDTPGGSSSGSSSSSGTIGGGSSSGGTSSSSSSSGGGSVDLQGYASEVCEKVQTCQPNGFLSDWATKDECVTEVIASSTAGLSALPGSKVTQAQIDACGSKLAAASCAFGLNDIQACSLTGTLANDTACYDGRQCQSGRCKRVTLSANCGTCATHQDVDGNCIEDDDCLFGLACAGGKCTKRLDQGKPCSADGVPCGPGLKCAKGTCADAVPKDGACTPDGNECSRGLTCQGNVCKEPIAAVAALGEKCPGNTACRKSSCRGAPGSEVCVALAKEGDACSGETNGAPACDADSACIDAKCEGNTFPDCR